jgi:hypothetical protein
MSFYHIDIYQTHAAQLRPSSLAPRSSRAGQKVQKNHFFFDGDPAGGLALENPPGVVAAVALILSFLGFLASLLLRI